MASLFIQDEMTFWKIGLDAHVPPQKIYLIEQLQTHKKLHEFLKVQKQELQDVDHVYDDLKFEQILGALNLGAERLPTGDVICSKCQKSVVDTAGESAPGDIKSQILARAKISIAKHLKETNWREYERTKMEKGAGTAGKKVDAEKQLAESQFKPKKVIPTHQILGKLQKTQDKIQKMISQKKRQVLDSALDESGPNSRDMDIIWNSVLGTFNQTFDAEQFRGEEGRLKKIFRDSDILTGIQPWLLYFNMPQSLIDHRLLPKRLVFPSSGRASRYGFPTTREVVDFFEKR